MTDKTLVDHTTEIVTAYVSRNQILATDLPGLIKGVFGAVSGLAGAAQEIDRGKEPAVPIKKSIADTYLVCLEDGVKLKMLKRYLKTHYDMSPEDYRRKWHLPPDYPMVAPAYARLRSEFAKSIGLGTIQGRNGKKGRKPTKPKE